MTASPPPGMVIVVFPQHILPAILCLVLALGVLILLLAGGNTRPRRRR